MNKKIRKALYSLLSVIFWIMVWQLGASIANKSLILPVPLPLETLKCFIKDLGSIAFLRAVWVSVLHIVIGFLSAVIIGGLCGIVSGSSEFFRTLSAPVLHLIRSVPVAAFIFLAWLWIPSFMLPSFIAALMVIPVVWGQVDSGLASADKKLFEMGKVFGMSKREINLRIRIPLLAPHLRTACVTGLGIAWKAGVAAEVICNPTGSVGALLQSAKATLDYEEVFSVVFAIVVLSLLLEALLKFVWKEKKNG